MWQLSCWRQPVARFIGNRDSEGIQLTSNGYLIIFQSEVNLVTIKHEFRKQWNTKLQLLRSVHVQSLFEKKELTRCRSTPHQQCESFVDAKNSIFTSILNEWKYLMNVHELGILLSFIELISLSWNNNHNNNLRILLLASLFRTSKSRENYAEASSIICRAMAP